MKKFAIHTAVQRLLAVGVAACLGALAQAGNLVYHSTLDSAESIISPVVGSAGTCTNAVFEQGYSGKALYLPASTSPVCIPFPNGLPAEKGCIEFWAKLNNKSQYVTTGGNPRFFCFNRTGTVNSSVAFLDINSTNGANGSGFTVVCGNIILPSIPESSYSYTRSFSYQSIMHGLDPQSWHRYVLRWNVNGLTEDSTSMLMLKLDDAVISTFPIASCNREEFMRMMKDSCELYFPLQDGFSDYSRVPYWIDEFKVWDSDRLGEAEPVLDDGVDVVNGVTWYYTLSQGKATIVKGSVPYAGDLTTPKTLDGHSVVAIAESAFADCSGLSSVVVSDGVVTVGDGAFARSRNVTRVSLPDSVIDIDQGCFYECEKLVDLRLPETLPIFNRFLMKGTAITSLVIPNGAKSIGDCAFYVAEKLESVTLPSTLTFIDWGAFHSATSLKSIEFPAGFQGFGNLNYNTTELYAVFGNCTSLEKAIFHGHLPYGLEYTWLTHLNCKIYYPREFASEWSAAIPAAKFGGYTEGIGGGEEPQPVPESDALYCVIDLSAGASATNYPVSYMNAAPNGGWTDEYKTSKLVLRRIEAGTFRQANTREATISQPYYIGVFEVTQAQYQNIMGVNPSIHVGAMRPIEYVSWNKLRGTNLGVQYPATTEVDATSVIGILRAKTGIATIDLPTECQWEYACRAGTTSAYNNGGSEVDDVVKLGRCGPNQNDGKGGYAETVVVGSYEPNAWGLYDMHGNVWEWCLDWGFNELSTDAVTDPAGATSGIRRVLRGGCWNAEYFYCDSALRHSDYPQINNWYGFRLACAADGNGSNPGAGGGNEPSTDPTLNDGIDVVNGVTWYYTLTDGKATIVKGAIPYAGDLATPTTLDGHPAVAIGESAFADCPGLSSVVVSDGVATIGNGAFARSRNVTRVSLPDSVTDIDQGCFYECEKLVDLRLPSTLPAFNRFLMKGTAITSLVIPNGAKSIGDCAFYVAEKLESVTLPSTLTFIDWGAFHSAVSLKAIEFPAGFQGFGNLNYSTTELYAVFGNCTSLEKAIFHGHLPYGLEYTWLTHLNCKIYYPREFASEWSAVIPAAKFGGYTEDLGGGNEPDPGPGGNEPDPGPGGGEEPVEPTAGELVYYTTFDSAAEFETPAVGPTGSVFNATFQEGKKGNALYVPAGQNAARVTFANGLPVEKGCIEFWAKIEGTSAYFGDGGNPCFYLFIPAGCAWKDTIESLELTGNNGLGKAGWHLVHTGCMWETTGSAFTVGNDEYQTVFGELAPKAWHHYQIRWNVNGLNGNSENVMLFTVDGVPMLATAKANFVRSTADYDGRLGIPLDLSFSEPLNPCRCNRVPFLIDEFKVWNSDVIGNGDPDPQPGENADDGVDVIDGVTWYYTLADGKATIVKGRIPYVGDLNVPESVDGHPVVAIGAQTFQLNNEVTSVYLPDSVRSIGGWAFDRCASLVGVRFPAEMDSVGNSAFSHCYSMTNNLLPMGIERIDIDMCHTWQALEEMRIPEGVKSLARATFNACTSLKRVWFPESFESFDHESNMEMHMQFGYCTALEAVYFAGPVPENLMYSGLQLYGKIYYSRKYAEAWATVVPASKFGGYLEDLGGNEPDPGPGGNEPDPGPGGGEEPVAPTPGELVYYTTFDSAAEFETPAVGPTGSVFNATFQEGKKGNALYVPAGQNAARVTFANGLPVEKGCIEFWAKIETGATGFGDGGNPCFYLFIPAGCTWKDTIESLELTGNNGLGKSGWHLVHTGGMWEASGSVGTYCTYDGVFGELAPTAWHHYQIRWNVNGLNGNSENVMLFTVDDVPMLKTSKAKFDRDHVDYFERIGVPLDLSFSEPLNPSRCNRVPFLIDEFKVWNSDVVGTTPEPTPTVDPTVEPTVDPVVEPTVDPVVEPTVDPVVEPTVDPVVEPTVDPVVEPTVDPVVEPTVDPVVEPTVDPVVEPVVEPEPSDEVKPLEFPVLEDGATVQVECRQGVAVEMPVVFGTLANPDARASGLPSGLKFKDGMITGVAKTATRANKPKSAKFTVKLPTGKKVKLVAEFTVLPRADWCVGTFDGAVLADGACVGTATFKLGANGKGTGSFTMIANGRKQKLALKCVSLKSYSAEREETKLALTTKDGSVLNFVLTANEDGVGRMETESGNPGCVMLQNVWKAKRVDAPAFLTGRNACTLTLDNGLTLKLQSKGVVKISGKVEGANGKLVKVNAKSQLLPEGFGDGESNASVVVFVPPKRALPSGIAELLPLRLEKNGAGVITRAVLVVVR